MLSTHTLISGILILLMGIFVLQKNIYSKVNIAFFLFCLSTFIWLFCFSFMYLNKDTNVALAWAKFGDIGILYLPIFAYFFVIVLLNLDKGVFKVIFNGAIVLSIPILFISQTDYFFIGIRQYNWGHYPLAGPLYILLILFFTLFMACIPILYFASKNTKDYSQPQLFQIQYVLFAFIGACTGFVDYLPKFNVSIYPWGHFSVLVFISIIAYAILKHHLMDISIVMRKGLVLSTIASIALFLYFLLLKYSNLLIANGIVQRPLYLVYLGSAFCALILHGLLGWLVLFNNPRKTLNKVFSLLSAFIFVWIVGCFIQTLTKDQGLALITEMIVSKFYVFIPAFFIHTFYEILNIKEKKILYLSYLSAFCLFMFSFSSIFIRGVTYNFGARFVTAPAELYFVFPLFVAIVSCTSLSQLIAKRKSATGYYKIQLDYLLLAGGAIVTAVFFSFLLIYKVIFTPFDELLNIVYGVTIGYAILKHRLMDIKVVIRKGLIYSLLIGLLAGLYLSFIYLFSNYLGGVGQGQSIVFSVAAMILFAVIFQPLRDKIQDLIDKVFFRGKYDYQKTLKELSLAARSIAGLDQLIDKVMTSIVGTIRIKRASIYVVDEKSGQLLDRKSINQAVHEKSISLDDPAIKYLEAKKEAITVDDNANTSEAMTAFMKQIGATIVFPIFSKDKLVGLLCLGEKLSGEVYSDEDIDLLTTLCNQMGVSIENAMLYEDALETQKRLFQADKLATVGALAAGLAHEIKNPIAAIKGFSQVIDRAVVEKDTEAIKDFKDVVPRQLDRINQIVEKLLLLSRPPKPEIKMVNMNDLLLDIIKLVEKQSLKQRVDIVKSFEEIPGTFADPEQLTQAFLNLILNAIQSMPEGGHVEIRTRFVGTDRILIEIADNGQGIPKDRLLKIFDPFYTTKETGSGLGLAITQKVILDHHGSIHVDSALGKGTKFMVTLPVK